MFLKDRKIFWCDGFLLAERMGYGGKGAARCAFDGASQTPAACDTRAAWSRKHLPHDADKRRASAIAMLRDWANEDPALPDETAAENAAVLCSLDEHRASYRKLFQSEMAPRAAHLPARNTIEVHRRCDTRVAVVVRDRTGKVEPKSGANAQ